MNGRCEVCGRVCWDGDTCARCAYEAEVRAHNGLCQVCLEPSTRSVCAGCEYEGGLYGDLLEDR